MDGCVGVAEAVAEAVAVAVAEINPSTINPSTIDPGICRARVFLGLLEPIRTLKKLVPSKKRKNPEHGKVPSAVPSKPGFFGPLPGGIVRTGRC